MEPEVSTLKTKASSTVREKLQIVIIALICCVYIAHGLFTLEESKQTIAEIVGNIAWSGTIGVIISSMFTSQGLKDGRNTELFLNSLKAYGDSKSRATPWFDKLTTWCSYKNAYDLEIRKREIVEGAGLNYRAFTVGYYDEHPEVLTEDQLKALENVDTCKVLKITQRELLSDMPKNKFSEKNRFGETVLEYQTKGTILDIIIKLALAIICGLYTLEPIKDSNWAGLVWNLLQILMWLSFGFQKYIDSKYFMEYEYRQSHLVQKTELFNEFIVTMQNNPNIIYTYDVNIDEEVDKFIKQKEEQKQLEAIQEQQTIE